MRTVGGPLTPENAMKFHVPEMSCGHCTAAIEKAVKAVDPSAAVATDLETREVIVSGSLDANRAQAVLAEAGYEATLRV